MKVLPRSLEALFCDSVRLEQGGFKTLVGIYATTFNVKALPYRFSRLCVYVRGTFPVEDPIGSLSVKVLIGSEEITSNEAPREFFERSSKRKSADERIASSFNTTLIMSGLEVTEPCDFTVVAVLDGEEYQIGELRVRKPEKDSER